MSTPLSSFNSLIRRLGRPPLQVPEVNLIPEEYLGRRGLSRRNLFILLIVVEILIAVTLFRTYGDGTVTTIRAFLGSEEPVSTTVVTENRLARQIKQARATLNDLKESQSEIDKQRVHWPQLLDLMFNQKPQDVDVTSFRQNEDEVTLAGRAKAHEDLFGYRDILKRAKFISQVVVPSIGAGSGTGDEVSFTFKLGLQRGVPVE